MLFNEQQKQQQLQWLYVVQIKSRIECLDVWWAEIQIIKPARSDPPSGLEDSMSALL